jgi:hypothetical protein
MNRVKSFDATGVAPNGRLYAGDLNAIEDAAAAQMDLAQILGVGTIATGESGLQVVRYGAGDLRITGAMRTDGIFRGLGGLFAGQFTTTQRNAIGVGLAPYGLIIFNTTTNQYEWNSGTDVARVWQSLGASEATVIADASRYGTFAARPAANTVAAGTIYWASDTGAAFRSDGANWIGPINPGAQIDYAQITADVTSITATTEGTANTIVASNSVTYDGSKVQVEAHIDGVTDVGGSASGSWNMIFVLFRDATALGQSIGSAMPLNGGTPTVSAKILDTPAAGAHTYTLKAFVTGTANYTVKAGTGGAGNFAPTYIRVTKA